jgi:diguanylate cyclase (GGDEF)-like protein/PAS domain S-box-containing protein
LNYASDSMATDKRAHGNSVTESAAAAGPHVSTLTLDEAGLVLGCDEAFTQMSGYAPEEVIGKNVLERIHADDQGSALEGWLEMLSSSRSTQIRLRLARKDRSWVWVASTVHNQLDRPERGRVLAEIIDVSAEMAAQEEAHELKELLRVLLDAMPDGVMQVDRDQLVVFHNARLREIMAVPGADLRPSGHTGSVPDTPAQEPSRTTREASAQKGSRTPIGALMGAVAEDSSSALQMALAQVLDEGVDRNIEMDVVAEQPRRVLASIRPLLDQNGDVSGALTTVLDITDTSRAREELERRAALDPLTHAHGRTSILTALQNELEGERREETAAVLVNLDGFKAVNDTLGHSLGDEVLVRMVERFSAATRSADRVGRLHDDEFLLVISGLPQPEVALGVAQRICESMRTRLELSSAEVDVSASIGVAFAGDEMIAAVDLVRRAHEAMCRSRDSGQGLPVLAGTRPPSPPDA